VANVFLVIKKLQGEGKKILLADMNTGFITKKDLVEGIHPNVEGYKKMSAVWEAAILEAREKRMLEEAEEIMRIST
jgi:lysophospholipase L1-like esterase